MTTPRPAASWRVGLLAALAIGCGGQGGSDDATVVTPPDAKNLVKTANTPDGAVEVPSPAPAEMPPKPGP